MSPCSSEGHGYTERCSSQIFCKKISWSRQGTDSLLSPLTKAMGRIILHAVKDDGGAVGLRVVENPAALRRWMVEGSTEKRSKLNPAHHEEAKHAQKVFERDVRSLANTIKEMGSPFTEERSDLLALDSSRDFVYPPVIDTVLQIEKLGEEQYDAYQRVACQSNKGHF